MKIYKKADIVIAWNRMPIYAARSINSIREELSMDFPVVYTKSKMPISGLEAILSDHIYCIKYGKSYSWADLGLKVPTIFFHSGWRYRHFNSLAEEVRSNGGNVIGLFDNNYRGDIRQILGSIYFKFFYLNKFHSVIVPGRSGQKLAQYFGIDKKSIHQGLYYADKKIFNRRKKLSSRSKTFLFVGQLVTRKGILEIVEAFQDFHTSNPDWSLRIIGEGPLKDKIVNKAGVLVENFASSEYISDAMNDSRFLVLSSYREHWGVVVHEATSCGCGLILSSSVGAGVDLATPYNSIVISRNSIELLSAAMQIASQKNIKELDFIESNSLSVSLNFSELVWKRSLKRILNTLH